MTRLRGNLDLVHSSSSSYTHGSRTSTPSRSSVTWGTTTRHILAGEETVAVSWDQGTGEVLFSIVSFSRPRHMLSLLSYPYVRAQQRRFARDAGRVMVRAGAGG